MNEFQKAIHYVKEQLDQHDISLIAEDDGTIYDLMEEYGADNDLPEGWWLNYGDESDVLAELSKL